MTHTASLALLVSTLVACGGTTPPPAVASGSATTVTPDAAVVEDRSFALYVGGTITSATGSSPLIATKVIRKGDEMVFAVKTTKAARVYVALCDTRQQLAIYPSTGAVLTAPNVEVRVPETRAFVSDDRKGVEHVFVIASSGDLDRNDPRLQELLSKAQQHDGSPCPPLEVSPPPAATTPTTGGQTGPAVRAAGGPQVPARTSTKVPPPLRPRGFDIPPDPGGQPHMKGITSDADGIAIWTTTLQHE